MALHLQITLFQVTLSRFAADRRVDVLHLAVAIRIRMQKQTHVHIYANEIIHIHCIQKDYAEIYYKM